jgi:hypothetical protein
MDSVDKQAPLPVTGLRQVRLTRSSVSDMLRGQKFPRKALMLTFVQACGIDIENDRHWEQAWNRLSEQYIGQTEIDLGQLHQEVTGLSLALVKAQERIDVLERENQEIGKQLAVTSERVKELEKVARQNEVSEPPRWRRTPGMPGL